MREHCGMAVRQALQLSALQPPDVVHTALGEDHFQAVTAMAQALDGRLAAQQQTGCGQRLGQVDFEHLPVAAAVADKAHAAAVGRGGQVDEVGAVARLKQHPWRRAVGVQLDEPGAPAVKLQRQHRRPGLNRAAQVRTVRQRLQRLALQSVHVVSVVQRVADIGLAHKHTTIGRHVQPCAAVHAQHAFARAVSRHAHQVRAAEPVFNHRQPSAGGQSRDAADGEERAGDGRAHGLGLAQDGGGARVHLLRQVGQEFGPQRVHHLAGGTVRRAVQARHDVAAVLLDHSGDAAGAVAPREKLHEVSAVQVLLVQRQRAAVGVDLGQADETPRALSAQPGLEQRALQAATACSGLALVPHRQAFHHPPRLEQVGHEPGHAAENALQHPRCAAHLVQVHGVRELMHQQQVEPGLVAQQFAFVRRGHEDAHQAEGQRRGEAVGNVEFVVDDDLGAPAWLPLQRLRHARVNPLGSTRHGVGLRALRAAVVDAEVRAVGAEPVHARVGQGLGHGGQSRAQQPGDEPTHDDRHIQSLGH